MTTPIDPIEPPAPPSPASPSDAPPAAFSATLRNSAILRMGVVLAAAVVLLVSAALTFGASPAPSAAAPSGAAPQAPDGNPGGRLRDRGLGGPGLFGLGRGGGRFGFGEISITAIDGSNVSLKTDDGWTRTIAVTGTTRITRGGAAITLVDLKVRDRIRFHEIRNADGTYSIDAVQVVLPHVVGKVTAKTADTITVEKPGGGTATIHVSASTTYRVVGKANASLADVAVGDIIGAQGQQRADGSLDATAVRAARTPGRWFGGRDGARRNAKPNPNGPNATPNATPGSYNAG
jgi:Domain of unknown function (DUF5666)